MCLVCMKYRILLLSLSAWVKYYYRILQTHHARTNERSEFQYFIVLGKKEYDFVQQSLLVWMVLYDLLLGCRFQ